MATQPKHSHADSKKSRAMVVKPGRMPVSEFTFDRPGAGSPFGDDVVFPIPADQLTYEHPREH